MVRRLADGLRHCGRARRGEADARAHAAVPAVRRARGDRRSGHEGRKERPKMNTRPAAGVGAVLVLVGCDRMPGRPGPREEVPRPEQVLDFNTLYKENCSGCHGADGKGSAAIALSDPVYLALADDAAILAVAAGGVPGTQMPPFAQSQGGMLTDQQIGVLVRGIRSWARPDAAVAGLPPYTATAT